MESKLREIEAEILGLNRQPVVLALLRKLAAIMQQWEEHSTDSYHSFVQTTN